MLDVDGINARVDTQMQKSTYVRGDIFSYCCAESFKVKCICYVNKLLFEMVKTVLKYAYLGTTTTTALQNEVSTCRKFIMIEILRLWPSIQ